MIAVAMMWFKSFYWLRLFGPTTQFVRLIKDTFMDIQFFLILFVMILSLFGNVVYILSKDRSDPLYSDYVGVEALNVLLSQY